MIHQSEFASGSPMERIQVEVAAESLPQPWPRKALVLSINHFSILVMPETIEGGQQLFSDIEGLKYHLTLAQRAIGDHVANLMEGKS